GSEGLAHDASREDADVGAFTVDAAERRALGRCREGRRPTEPPGQPSRKTREAEPRADVGETCRESETTRARDGFERGTRERPAPGTWGNSSGRGHTRCTSRDPRS